MLHSQREKQQAAPPSFRNRPQRSGPVSGFDDHFQQSELARHRHERRGGGTHSTRLIRLHSPAHQIRDPATPELTLGLILSGTSGARWSWDGAAANVTASRRPGTLGLTPVGTAGTFEVDGPSTILIVSLPYVALAERLAPEMSIPRDFGPLHDAYQEHAAARDICKRLWRAAGTASFGRDGQIDNLAETLLVTLSGGGHEDRRDTRGLSWLERSRVVARASYADPDVSALAEAIAMPVRTFRRRFQATFGLSPQRWLAARRIDEATRLLGNRRLSLSEIALDLGFANQAHFTAAFRQTTGKSPGRWRRDALD